MEQINDSRESNFVPVYEHGMKNEIIATLGTTDASAQSGSGHLWTDDQIRRLDKSIQDAKQRRLNRNV